MEQEVKRAPSLFRRLLPVASPRTTYAISGFEHTPARMALMKCRQPRHGAADAAENRIWRAHISLQRAATMWWPGRPRDGKCAASVTQ